MSITSGSFVLIVVLCTFIIFALAVLLLPRRRKAGVRKYIEQFFALLLCMVTAVFAVAVSLNAQNNWYGSWAALFSNGRSASSTIYSSATPTPIATEADLSQNISPLQANPTTNPFFGSQITGDTSQGKYVKFDITGSASGSTIHMLAWLPPSYFTNPTRFFPVVVGFAGFPGSLDIYSDTLNYGQMIMQQVQAGTMREAILLVPDISPGNYDSECVDGTQGNGTPKMETFISEDLVSWARQNLRIFDDTNAWATSGYSAGGFCSMMITIRHPSIFGFSLSQSGYFSPIYTSGQEWTTADDPRYNLTKMVSEQRPSVGIFAYLAQDDSIATNGLSAFQDAVKSPTKFQLASIPTGGHSAAIWRPGIEQGLTWLGQQSSYFAPLK